MLSKLYETLKMHTLLIKFTDKEIVLKNKQEEINNAKDIGVTKTEHEKQVYSNVFNRTVTSGDSRHKPGPCDINHISIHISDMPHKPRARWQSDV